MAAFSTPGSKIFRALKEENIGELSLRLPDAKDFLTPCGHTPLTWAICRGSLDLAMQLIELGLNVNLRNSRKQTPLLLTLYEKEGEDRNTLLRALIRRGANPFAREGNDETAFEIAEALCDEMIIKIFKEGTSLASLSFNSFVIACIEGDLQIMKGMLEKGFNPNIPIDNSTPLITCTLDENLTAVKMLLHYGAAKNPLDHFGKSAYDYACQLNHAELKALLFFTEPSPKRRTVLLLGKTGHGKSTLANLLCGDAKFKIGFGVQSETSICQSAIVELEGGIELEIIDTPGLADTSGRHQETEIMNCLCKCLQDCRTGIHRIFMVTSGRLTAEEQLVLENLYSIFLSSSVAPLEKITTVVRTKCESWDDKAWCFSEIAILRKRSALFRSIQNLLFVNVDCLESARNHEERASMVRRHGRLRDKLLRHVLQTPIPMMPPSIDTLDPIILEYLERENQVQEKKKQLEQMNQQLNQLQQESADELTISSASLTAEIARLEAVELSQMKQIDVTAGFARAELHLEEGQRKIEIERWNSEIQKVQSELRALEAKAGTVKKEAEKSVRQLSMQGLRM